MAVFPACQPCTNTVGFLSLTSYPTVVKSFYFSKVAFIRIVFYCYFYSLF